MPGCFLKYFSRQIMCMLSKTFFKWTLEFLDYDISTTLVFLFECLRSYLPQFDVMRPLSSLLKIMQIFFWLPWVFIAACRLSLAAASGGFSLVAEWRLLNAWLLLLQSHRLQYLQLTSAGSVIMAHRLSCSTACGIFPDQGLNPYPPPHWQVDSYPPVPPGKFQFFWGFINI